MTVSSGDRLRQPTADIRATDQAAVQAAQRANDLNSLIVDDASQGQNPDPIVFGRGGLPLSAGNTLRGGDSLTDAVGVLTYTWAGNAASGNAYRLRPVGALGGSAVFQPVNHRPTALPDVGSGGIKVASANLLNFFNTFTGCTFGTAVDRPTAAAPTTTPSTSVSWPRRSHRCGSSGPTSSATWRWRTTGTARPARCRRSSTPLNAVDGPGAWAFVDPDAALGVVDVAGTDAIKAGLLYRTASVSVVPGATFVDQNPVFERRPVAQTFETPSGARFTVIANHFKSKGSCPTTTGPDSDLGDGQSCWNARRTAQAQELASWVGGTVIPGAGDPDVAIVGDLNSYAGEDPIAALETAGYANLVKEFHGDEAYSYVFDGQWGYLDYVMTSSSLLPQVTGAADVHHNADEPSVLDFNTEFKSSGQIASLYAPDRFRTSDHDPVLAGLDLIGRVETTTVVTSSANPSTIGGPVQFTATVSGEPTGGTVQFEVDGEALGGPVDVVDGVAVSPVTSTLSLGTRRCPPTTRVASRLFRAAAL